MEKSCLSSLICVCFILQAFQRILFVFGIRLLYASLSEVGLDSILITLIRILFYIRVKPKAALSKHVYYVKEWLIYVA